MIYQRRTVTRRITIRTPTAVVEVWENSDGEVLELIRIGGRLKDIVQVKVTFDECVQSHKAKCHKLLVSRQAIEQGEVSFAA